MAKLRLEAVDVYGSPVLQGFDYVLRNLILNLTLRAHKSRNRGSVTIQNLSGFPKGRYLVEADPRSYFPDRRFVNVAASGTTSVRSTFVIDASKVVEVVFPVFGKLAKKAQDLLKSSNAILGLEGQKGQALYKTLESDKLRKAGFLNIVTKCQDTFLTGGRTVLDHLKELKKLRGDRFFVFASQALREETKDSVAAGIFKKVSGALHKPPRGFEDYEEDGSFKTHDRYGNLQLTFFSLDDATKDCLVDIDIDDANGLGHVFQVLRNRLGNRDTHPYDIHQILLEEQMLDTGYRLRV